jgi:molybdenum cofactor guanylyltransferase
MTRPTSTFAAVVLNGGRSRRMGHDKATTPVAGRPMAAWVIDALRDAGASSIRLLGGEPATADVLGVDHRRDPNEGSGPLGALAVALTSIEATVVVVVGCDMPCITAGTLVSLIEALTATLDDDDDVDVAIAHTTQDEPLCAAWRIASTAPVVLAAFASGTRAVHEVLADLSVTRVQSPEAELLNVNTPNELERAETVLRERHGPPRR